MREKLAISEDRWPQVIKDLCDFNHIEEAAVLSTCNRMEIYFVALSQSRGVKEVTDWMSKVYYIIIILVKVMNVLLAKSPFWSSKVITVLHGSETPESLNKSLKLLVVSLSY